MEVTDSDAPIGKVDLAGLLKAPHRLVAFIKGWEDRFLTAL